MKEYIVRIEHGADGAVHYFRTGGEIVRCKDCKHSGICDLNVRACYRKTDCVCLVPDDGYCNFGERRSDEID